MLLKLTMPEEGYTQPNGGDKQEDNRGVCYVGTAVINTLSDES